MEMTFRVLTIDRYITRLLLGTMAAVLAVVMCLMILEHLPRLLEITRLSGHRGYIVAETVLGLLPEYGGIGLIVGLFLGISLTVRRLSIRGELDVIEACGIGPTRWMRFPMLITALVSMLTLLNQGWLMPNGEARLADIGHRMEIGEFGHQLPAGEFIDLGSGSVLQFRNVDTSTGRLDGVFLRTREETYTASQGRLWKLPSGATMVELHNGQVFQDRDAKVLAFARFEYRAGAHPDRAVVGSEDILLKRADLASLWSAGTMSSRSVFYGRCLWALFALLIPAMALVLGKPPIRQTGTVGIILGTIVLVLGLKMITPLVDGHSSRPEWMAIGVLAIWGLYAFGLIRAEKLFGRGFVDRWANQIFQYTAKQRYFIRTLRLTNAVRRSSELHFLKCGQSVVGHPAGCDSLIQLQVYRPRRQRLVKLRYSREE